MHRTRMIVLAIVVALAATLPAARLRAQQPPRSGSAGTQVARPLPNATGLGYYEYLPEGYGGGQRYPLIIFFHGIGERGNGNSELPWVLRLGPPRMIDRGASFPAIVISPQLPMQQYAWKSEITAPFVDYILKHYSVDRARVYITGLSLGGGGAWIYAKNHPDLVAAVVPICGTESSAGYGALAGIPLWAFHSEGDQTVTYDKTTAKLKVITGFDPEPTRPKDNQLPGYTAGFDGEKWVWRLGQAEPPAGQNPILTTYEGADHDAWTRAYGNQALWDWLFRQYRAQRIYAPLIRR
ncbi:MAG TPA: alpha/beta fold hydrolase [Herpetosiphonaceae bacterium]|nr:alpha/beta fold hydrolase [Herpetosiphonaceae bacterium]